MPLAYVGNTVKQAYNSNNKVFSAAAFSKPLTSKQRKAQAYHEKKQAMLRQQQLEGASVAQKI